MINTVLHCLIPLITVWIASKYLHIFFEKKADSYIFHILLWVSFYLYQVYDNSLSIFVTPPFLVSFYVIKKLFRKFYIGG